MTTTIVSKRYRAFSLVETMVVAGLLTTVLLFAMALIPSFKMSNKRASMELQAATLAQSALEAARAVDFDDLVTSSPAATVIDGVTYNQTVTVTNSASGYAKTVRVVEEWKWKEQTHQLFRETVICRIPRG